MLWAIFLDNVWKISRFCLPEALKETGGSLLECLLYQYLTKDLYPEYINNFYDLIIKRQTTQVSKTLKWDFTSVSIVSTLVSLLMVFNKCMQLCHPQPFSQYRMFLPPKTQKRKEKKTCLHPRTFIPFAPFHFHWSGNYPHWSRFACFKTSYKGTQSMAFSESGL